MRMPMFEFKCRKCGLKFEKLIRDRDVEEYPCLDCGTSSEKALSQFGFQFASGKTPGNTGVDSLDSSIDKKVGRDAEQRWEAIKDRKSAKRQIQKDHGEEGKVPLRKNPNTGEYEKMEPGEVERFQNLHREYSEIYEDHKNQRTEAGIGKFRDDDPYVRYRESKAKDGGTDS